jgi:hypothetical protein
MLLGSMLLALVSSTGCNLLFGRRGGPGGDLDLTQLQREGYSLGTNGVMLGGTVDDTSVLLEVNDGKKHLEKIPMTEGQPMFVADLIRDAKEAGWRIYKSKGEWRHEHPDALSVESDFDFPE